MQAAVGGCRGSSVGSLVASVLSSLRVLSLYVKNRVIVCILNLLVIFGERDVGDGLGTCTAKPCLEVLSHK